MAQPYMHQQLKRLSKNHWALSTVVTTLIIIVISVLLASVVTYVAINVTSTRVQQESLALTKQHVWYDSASQEAEAAIMITNSGGRDIVIDRLTVRGQECPWLNVLFSTTSESISGDLFYNMTLVDGGSISVGGSNHVFKQATTDLTLQSGKTMIIYLANPDSITVNDMGLTVSINLFTSQAMYHKETNVQGTNGIPTVSNVPRATPSGKAIQIPYTIAYSPSTVSGGNQEVGLVVTNAGSVSETFTPTDFLIDFGIPDNIIAMYAKVGVTSPTSTLPYFNSGDTVQNVTPELTSSFTIAPGETGIIYYIMAPSAETLWEEGQTFLVQLVLGNDDSVIRRATVYIHDTG